MRRDQAGAGRVDDETNTRSTWWARHSGEQFRSHPRPHDQENVGRRIRECRARELDRHIHRYAKSRRHSSQRRTHRELVLGQRTDGLVRAGELFLEQSRHHCANKSFGERVCASEHHRECDRARFHRCRHEQRHARRSDAKFHQANSARPPRQRE